MDFQLKDIAAKVVALKDKGNKRPIQSYCSMDGSR